MTRQEHMDWCKQRALEYLKPGQSYSVTNAVTSMLSDIRKHPETEDKSGALGMLGIAALQSGDAGEARKFIEGFN